MVKVVRSRVKSPDVALHRSLMSNSVSLSGLRQHGLGLNCVDVSEAEDPTRLSCSGFNKEVSCDFRRTTHMGSKIYTYSLITLGFLRERIQVPITEWRRTGSHFGEPVSNCSREEKAGAEVSMYRRWDGCRCMSLGRIVGGSHCLALDRMNMWEPRPD